MDRPVGDDDVRSRNFTSNPIIRIEESDMCAFVVRVSDLELAEAKALLTELHVGAMAFAFRDRVGISLVNYVYQGGWVYARMEDGPDLETIRHHRWAALEVRDAAGIYDWQTVTVNGPVELLSTTESQAGARELQAATDVLRSVVPAVFTARDPLPERVQIFRLYADLIVGREARTYTRESLRRPSVAIPVRSARPGT
jgi:nitroimidazol reductase NimA-like FMN-containing flavoprotein (pyridoxamine 5'-phosphate oxidase superfamily)